MRVMDLSDNLKKSNILLKVRSGNSRELINELVDLAVKNEEIEPSDSDEIKKALVEREKSMSTGIGHGVALPHCNTARVKDIVLLMALIPKGIDFNASDNLPVQIVIMLLVPKNKLTQHIKTLANIAKLMKNEDLRNSLVSLKTAERIIKKIKDFEDKK
jgi:fructose-specific phosphotransferase system IIA component